MFFGARKLRAEKTYTVPPSFFFIFLKTRNLLVHRIYVVAVFNAEPLLVKDNYLGFFGFKSYPQILWITLWLTFIKLS